MRYLSVFIFALALVNMKTYAQEKGIVFEKGMQWGQLLAKAKKENKLIFLDCYTTWCAPCKRMAQNVFKSTEVGQFMNEKFISVSMQMDSTKHDEDLIKAAYSEAHEIAVKNTIDVYPTFLFFSPNGNVSHRCVGEYDVNGFLDVAKDALNPDKQYYSLSEKFKKNNRSPEIIVDFVEAAVKAGFDSIAIANSGLYIRNLKNPFLKGKIKIILSLTKSSSSDGYNLFLRNIQQVDDNFEDQIAEHTIINILLKEEAEPLYQSKDSLINWTSLRAKLQEKSNANLADRAIAKEKLTYYEWRGDWDEYEKTLIYYLNAYGRKINGLVINNYLWNIFVHSDNTDNILNFLPWSKSTLVVDGQTQLESYDTYANLLYKVGRKDDAIFWEQKGMQIAKEQRNDAEEKIFNETINKMKRNEKTWL